MWTTGAEAESDEGYESIFNLEVFSDRVLRIEVVGGSAAAAGGSPADRKRRREEEEGDDGEDIDSCTVMGTPILRVNTVYVSSEILAAKSSFFFKLFSNGMKESGQREVTVRIADAGNSRLQYTLLRLLMTDDSSLPLVNLTGVAPVVSYGIVSVILMPPRFHFLLGTEENAFIELLRFMYSGKLTPTTDPALLVDILMAADKFDVVSCMKLCRQRLKDLPMTPEFAVLCLDLPSSISVAAILTEGAKRCLSERFRDFLSTEFQDELMRIPLAGIEAILSRNDLRVASEVDVYDFVLRWAFSQYQNTEERHQILSSRLLPLVPLVRFVSNATIVDQPHCVINVSLNREKCHQLFLLRSPLCSHPFRCAGHGLCLSAHCNNKMSNFCFGLEIAMLEDKGPVRATMVYTFEVKTRLSNGFVTMYKGAFASDSKKAVGCKDLFGVPWLEFVADESPFFIDDMLHLRVDVKIKSLLY
ncbi:hypothetical protein ACQ4PT_045241 [Festuca glaucescens]